MEQNNTLPSPCDRCHIAPEHRDACRFRHCEKWLDWFSAGWQESTNRLKINPQNKSNTAHR